MSRRPRDAGEDINESLTSSVYRHVLSKEQLGDLDSMGYPKPPTTMLDVNTFEETFGDIYPNGVWREFSRKVSSNIDRYIVALASFNGCRRSFACTGFLIEWNGSTTVLTSASLVRSSSDENRIDENLRIEVLLPSKRRIEGTLQHYSLHYNVALVSVKDCRVVRPANVQHCRFGWSKVASVGRCFKSGALMAMGGDLVSWSGTLDCPCIVRSSCKITKTGIGGPLVNLEGEVIGMNFYDTRIGTPFLLWSEIDNILAHFAEISDSMAGGVGSDDSEMNPAAVFWKMDGDHSDRLSRWPVPAPCWRRRGDVDKEKCDDDELVCYDPQSGRNRRYGYILGVKVELYYIS
ncbi:unnamed protein product [Urochloa decumbens]|uniref:Uncharacterized protein n=1 Tax=Urochloa decumbens TaxID=240449 RepID=A0ABC9H2C1_9POAL